jgi:methionyl-tRNA synthetase
MNDELMKDHRQFVENAVSKYKEAMDGNDVQGAMEIIGSIGRACDRLIEKTRPWELAEKEKEEMKMNMIWDEYKEAASRAGVIAGMLGELNYKQLQETKMCYDATKDKPALTEAGEYSAKAMAMIADFAEQFQKAGFNINTREKFGKQPMFVEDDKKET